MENRRGDYTTSQQDPFCSTSKQAYPLLCLNVFSTPPPLPIVLSLPFPAPLNTHWMIHSHPPPPEPWASLAYCNASFLNETISWLVRLSHPRSSTVRSKGTASCLSTLQCLLGFSGKSYFCLNLLSNNDIDSCSLLIVLDQ